MRFVLYNSNSDDNHNKNILYSIQEIILNLVIVALTSFAIYASFIFLFFLIKKIEFSFLAVLLYLTLIILLVSSFFQLLFLFIDIFYIIKELKKYILCINTKHKQTVTNSNKK